MLKLGQHGHIYIYIFALIKLHFEPSEGVKGMNEEDQNKGNYNSLDVK